MRWRDPLARGAFVLLLGLLPWPGLRAAFARVYCPLVDRVLAAHHFGNGGRARLEAAPPTDVRRPGEHVTSDATLRLAVEGHRGALTLGLDLRRDVYLPLVLTLALTLAATRRVRVVALALPASLLLATGSVWLLATSVFARELSLVYPPGTAAVVDLVFRTVLLPPANRFMAPLLLVAMLVLWQRAPRQGASS